jgi:hypothetical protein
MFSAMQKLVEAALWFSPEPVTLLGFAYLVASASHNINFRDRVRTRYLPRDETPPSALYGHLITLYILSLLSFHSFSFCTAGSTPPKCHQNQNSMSRISLVRHYWKEHPAICKSSGTGRRSQIRKMHTGCWKRIIRPVTSPSIPPTVYCHDSDTVKLIISQNPPSPSP